MSRSSLGLKSFPQSAMEPATIPCQLDYAFVCTNAPVRKAYKLQ
jgi:hypothetical protein